MRILVITRSAWDDSNSTGNTMSNFFNKFPIENIANLYVRSAMPNNCVCKNYYSISDKDVFRSLFSFNNIAGKAFTWEIRKDRSSGSLSKDEIEEDRLYSFFRRKSFVWALWGQNLLWRLGNWRNQNLDNFLDQFKPDIIFSPSFHTSYTHRILWYIQKKTNAKVVLFHADDYLSIQKKGVSFLEQLNQKIRAKVVESSVLKADLNYCISHLQQEEYQKKICKKMNLLFKGADFSVQPEYTLPGEGKPIRIVYIGSILYGRWRTLSLLAKEISEINKEKTKFELIIYSQYELTQEMKDKMIIEGASIFMGKVPSDQVKYTLMDADIVLHLESFDDVEKEKTRLSFSTKIVDCLNSGRALMAIGWDKAASIDYLVKNDAALVATDVNGISDLLNEIQLDRNILKEYADKAWTCGKRNHQIDEIQKNLYQELSSLVKED
ncbi:hypothetical protein [Acetoanaerobium noterae]|uniref:hypothetical protein n=1 Tax=Acetoanaerobium noterae TaxID=745369 RepID=UPI0028AE7EF3|nr:hypothetical protein [Acetoanaerobium noterae]